MKKLSTLAGAALLAVSAAASAQVTTTVHVPYGDLNLGKPAGMRTLARRLDAALSKVCGDYASAPTNDWPNIQRCRKATQKSITPQVAVARQRQGVAEEIRTAAR